MRFLSIILLTLISVIMLCSCGGKEKLVKKETNLYNAAITTFLSKKAMGMKVVEFISVDTNENTSSCVVKMQDVNGLYSIKPKWEFKFVKNDGKWEVRSYKVL